MTRKKRMKLKSNFWSDEVMHPLLTQYKSFWNAKTKPAKLLVPPSVRDAVWERIQPELAKVAHAVARTLNPTLNNKDIIADAMLHAHHVVVYNWGPERPKSYSYFYTCFRAWFLDYLQGSGRAKIGGQIGKKHIVRKTISIPVEFEKEEAMKIANEEDHWEWHWSGWVRRKPGDSKTHKRFTVYRYDRELVSWETEFDEIPDQDEWSWSKIADLIDWQVLSEYIPDTTSSNYTKKLAYIMLDVIRMMVENELKKNTSVMLVNQMVRARMKHTVANHQLHLAKDCLRQAFRFYYEDELSEQ